MSRLDHLLADLCPDGVKSFRLGDLAELARGSTITKDQTLPGNVPVVAGGRTPAYYHNSSNRLAGTITVAGSGAYAGFVSWWDQPVWVSDAFSVAPKEADLLPKYCYYFLLARQDELHRMKTGGGVPHVYPKQVAEIRIPVPPIAVQREIIRVLDKFTQLEAELEAELEARRKQYEYYRHVLLRDLVATSSQTHSLEKLFNLRGGYTPSKASASAWQDGTIPWIRVEDIRHNGRKLDSAIQHVNASAVKGGRLFPANSFLLSTSATIGEHALVTVPHIANQRFLSLNLKQEAANKYDIRFLFHYMFVVSDWCRKNTATSSFPSVNMAGLRSFCFPEPPMADQQEIASSLDLFDALVNDLSSGLPAEIAARRKQYGYYREKLLTFKEADA